MLAVKASPSTRALLTTQPGEAPPAPGAGVEPPDDEPPFPLPESELPPLPPEPLESPPGEAPPDEPSAALVVEGSVVAGAGFTAAPEPPPGTVRPVTGAVSAVGLLPPHADIPRATVTPARAVAARRLRCLAEVPFSGIRGSGGRRDGRR